MYASTWIRACLSTLLIVKMDTLASQAGCGSPLGMQSGVITNAQIRASSSQHYQLSPPHAARLFNTRSNQSPVSFGGWCAKRRNLHQYLLIDFLATKNITGISSQGLNLVGENWVSSYSISYSCDGRLWLPYKLGGIAKIFDANNDTDSVVRNNFPAPIVARMVRIHPITWNFWGSICARVEIHGCHSNQVCRPTAPPTSPPPNTTRLSTAHALSARTLRTQPVKTTSKQTTTQKPSTQPPCIYPLGMENYRIKDSQITASSFQNIFTRPSSGRLNNRLKNTMSFGSWCALTKNKNQYLQVDLLTPMTIVAIATQGMASPAGNWVRSYKVSYSCDGAKWFLYEHRGKQKVFKANRDSHSTVKHYLKRPLTTRLVRLRPVTWNRFGEICLRMELYGCNSSQACTKGNTSESALPITTTPPQELHTSKIPASIPVAHSEPTLKQDWTKPTNQTSVTNQKKRIIIIIQKIEDDDMISCSQRININIVCVLFIMIHILACIT